MAIIYISSTYSDLKKEREAAAKAIRRLGHHAIAMEDYVASDMRPVDKCLQDIRSCDAYVGIFAWRYGYIPDGYDKSITHLEYETAKKASIPCLIFLLDDKVAWPVAYIGKGEERQRIDRLHRELKNERIVSFFHNANELSALVTAAVSNLYFDSGRHLSKLKPKLGPIVSKMCGRVIHVGGFQKFFLEKSKKYPKRPQFYFIHGNEGEAHESFLERIMKTFLKEYVEREWHKEPATISFSEVLFPKKGKLSDMKDYLQLNLINRFSKLYNVSDFTVNTLGRLPCFEKQQLVLIKHNIYSSKWDKFTQPLLNWYIKDYWAALECDDKEEIPLFLIFFLIKYQEEALKTKIFKRRHNSKEHIREQLYSICTSMDEESQCIVLPELMPVEIEDVMDWFENYNIYEYLWERKEIVDSIFRDKNGRAVSSKSMLEIELEFQRILEGYDANVNLDIDDNVEIIQKPNYNDEAIRLIKKEKYEEALLIIVKAENNRLADDNGL